MTALVIASPGHWPLGGYWRQATRLALVLDVVMVLDDVTGEAWQKI